MLELAFVMAPHQNLFFRELVGALRHELAQMGVPSSVTEDEFPAPRPDLVYVLVPPHEFYALSERHDEDDGLLARTIFISAEQPTQGHFAENVRLAPKAGAVFDINARATREYHRNGIAAQHLQIGYSGYWD